MDTNYFICTLGQAALPGISRPFRNINHLIDQQALAHPGHPAVGFYDLDKQQSTYATRILSFIEVRQGILNVASTIKQNVVIPKKQTVGLLCDSSPAFLFTWLGLIRLGHPVLLIAPQCSASAIAHLSKACSANILFHDRAHEKLAHESVSASSDVNFGTMSSQPLPFEEEEEIYRLARSTRNSDAAYESPLETEVAYLHHTSGTSSGIPKPIPQTHRGGVAVLPALDGTAAATFTTTPLYHGGVADMFRSWTSSALIWLFPAQYVPITATNVVRCLEASEAVSRDLRAPTVKYFSSVPYVLQMMAQDAKGLRYLQKMEIVGVGGAALPPEVGDRLVDNDINLVSRYGSAECGFLMSSHRDYRKDKEWQYLRKAEEVEYLRFERQNDGLSELIIEPGWPHMAKTNREDGSFATADLFAPHPTLQNTWRYHSRADSQLTLITGKKFDPSPLEGSIVASSALLNEVLIFGNGKPYPGALLFRSENAEGTSDVDVVKALAPIVEKLNAESQSHARIPRNMLIPMPYEAVPLQKSSKGTILRGNAEEKFHEQIETAYNRVTLSDANVADEDIPDAILKIVQSVVSTAQYDEQSLTEDTDLFSYGVDSVACVQIRHALGQLMPRTEEALPLTIVEDSGNITNLSKVIVQRRRGEVTKSDQDSHKLIQQLVEQYSSFEHIDRRPPETKRELGSTVLLTGPTGLLGAHILAQLFACSQVKRIYLLVRGATAHAAKERVLKSLSSRMLTIPADVDEKIRVMPCRIAESNLGLSKDDYDLLASRVDRIIHVAWSVNFLISLRSIASTHLAGLQNLLNFALTASRSPQFIFCSSVASVSGLLGNGPIPETLIEDLNVCGATGYSQSKLAAELICSTYAASNQLKGRITVIRIGQLSGDTQTGVWNMSEAYPLMLASSKTTGVLPDLKNEKLGWLPVDTAAKSLLEATFEYDGNSERAAYKASKHNNDGDNTIRVLHLLNPSNSTTWKDLTGCVVNSGEEIEVVPVDTWLEKLEQLQSDDKTKFHSSLKLLPFWKETYGTQSISMESTTNGDASSINDHSSERAMEDQYCMDLSKASMPTLESAVGALDSDYIMKIWNWIRHNAD